MAPLLDKSEVRMNPHDISAICLRYVCDMFGYAPMHSDMLQYAPICYDMLRYATICYDMLRYAPTCSYTFDMLRICLRYASHVCILDMLQDMLAICISFTYFGICEGYALDMLRYIRYDLI